MKNRLATFFFSNWVLMFLMAAIISAIVDIFAYGRKPVESFLLYLLVMNYGLAHINSFCWHWFEPLAGKVRAGLGWASSPFQREVAAADGAFGVLGVLCYWLRGDFWTATVIGCSVMYFMMGIGHFLDLAKKGNRAVLNAGIILYYDLALPVVMIILLILWKQGI